MQDHIETPEQKRERLRQLELKGNPIGNLNDSYNRANNSGLADLIGSLGLKSAGILILLILSGIIIASIFFY